MTTARVVCVGNSLVPGDDCGPRVLDLLRRRALPPCVDLVDGGLSGLDLLGAFDGPERVVVVDSLSTETADTTARAVPLAEMVTAQGCRYDHDGAMAYLLAALPAALGDRCPRVTVVGAAGVLAEATVAAVADLALALSRDPHHPGWRLSWP